LYRDVSWLAELGQVWAVQRQADPDRATVRVVFTDSRVWTPPSSARDRVAKPNRRRPLRPHGTKGRWAADGKEDVRSVLVVRGHLRDRPVVCGLLLRPGVPAELDTAGPIIMH
jgi:hypothetical protein